MESGLRVIPKQKPFPTERAPQKFQQVISYGATRTGGFSMRKSPKKELGQLKAEVQSGGEQGAPQAFFILKSYKPSYAPTVK